jgi:hypothetical protein
MQSDPSLAVSPTDRCSRPVCEPVIPSPDAAGVARPLPQDTPLLAVEETRRFLDECDAVAPVQEQVLTRMLRGPLADTALAREHGLHAVHGSAEFRRSVPLHEYEDLRPYIDRGMAGESAVVTRERPLAYFTTSGTSASPKHIPVTPSFMREKARAFGIFWSLCHQDHPVLRGGRVIANFGDGGRDTQSADGVPILSETTFWNRRMSGLQARAGWALPPAIRTIADPELRYYAVARVAMAGDLHGIMCLNPSTLVRLCRVIERHGDDLLRGIHEGTLGYGGAVEPGIAEALAPALHADPARASRLGQAAPGWSLDRIWPELELAICWHSEMVRPYLRQLGPLLGRVRTRDYITQGSECIMAIPLRNGVSGGLLAYTCHFFEFVCDIHIEDAQPPTLLPHELEVGSVYELVVTTGGGLVRYRMGDCFRVVGFRGRTPMLEFLHRKGRTSSITGEKLTEQQVLEAARESERLCGSAPAEFLCFPRSGDPPHYGVLMRWDPSRTDGGGQQALRWTAALDASLQKLNGEYADKRRSGRLGPPLAVAAGPHGFDRVRRRWTETGISEEQVKLGVLSRLIDLDAELPPRQGDAARPL